MTQPTLTSPKGRAAVPPADVMSLKSLRAGQSGQIIELTGDPDLIHRLREIGLQEGLVVRMLQPGNPCMIRLAGRKLGFRADGAAHVMVRPVPE
ncbi:MAG: FeoA family protein [Isosphaeraceae bacterium]